MKNKLIMTAVGILMVCLLPCTANAKDNNWQSTSTMQLSGSSYSSPMTEVGATETYDMASTTGSVPGKRKAKMDGPDFGDPTETNKDEEWDDKNSPVGEPWVLLAMAAAAAATIAVRRRRAAGSSAGE